MFQSMGGATSSMPGVLGSVPDLWLPACTAVKAEQHLQTCPFICPSVLSLHKPRQEASRHYRNGQSYLGKDRITVEDTCMNTQGQVSGSNKSFTSPDVELISGHFLGKDDLGVMFTERKGV